MMSEEDLYIKMERMRKQNRLAVRFAPEKKSKFNRLLQCFIAVVLVLLVSSSLILIFR